MHIATEYAATPTAGELNARSLAEQQPPARRQSPEHAAAAQVLQAREDLSTAQREAEANALRLRDEYARDRSPQALQRERDEAALAGRPPPAHNADLLPALQRQQSQLDAVVEVRRRALQAADRALLGALVPKYRQTYLEAADACGAALVLLQHASNEAGMGPAFAALGAFKIPSPTGSREEFGGYGIRHSHASLVDAGGVHRAMQQVKHDVAELLTDIEIAKRLVEATPEGDLQ